jgi:hypothetical protein
VQWLEAQAAAVREGRWSDVDAANVAEELDSLAGSDRRELRSRLRVLMTHVLKREAQPDRHSRSWELTILEQSDHITELLAASPSLRRELGTALRERYGAARKRAAFETRLPLTAFPAEPTAAFEASVLQSIDDAAKEG